MVNDWADELGPERCGQLIDPSSYFTRSLAWNLTHLTADIAFFSPLPPGESDYEKWKSVFNAIQGLEEVKYFVCVRENTAVFGRFSSLKPLARALTAVVKMKMPKGLNKMDLKWLDDIVPTNVPVLYPELLSRSSSVISRSGLKASWCSRLWKRLCCWK